MINIVIPMAGEGKRFADAGYLKPKPFIDVHGKPMIIRVIENLAYLNAKYILIARSKHLQEEKALVGFIERNHNAKFIETDILTQGSACTVLLSQSLIDNQTPLLIANSDQIIDHGVSKFINDFKSRNLDGSIMSFMDTLRNPKWSYIRLGDDDLVVQAKEKDPISDFATVGIYLYAHGRYFVESASEMIASDDRVNEEFYTCPTYNYLIRSGKRIGSFNINSQSMHGIGTPEDLEIYLKYIKSKTSPDSI